MTAVDPGPLLCPHCGSADVDRGQTGLDQCNQCDGLSREGHPLRVQQLTEVMVVTGRAPVGLDAHKFAEAVSARSGRPVLIVYSPEGTDMTMASEADMAKWGWFRASAIHEAFRAGQRNATWALGADLGDAQDSTLLESPEELIARLSMGVTTDGVPTKEEVDDGAATADQSG